MTKRVPATIPQHLQLPIEEEDWQLKATAQPSLVDEMKRLLPAACKALPELRRRLETTKKADSVEGSVPADYHTAAFILREWVVKNKLSLLIEESTTSEMKRAFPFALRRFNKDIASRVNGIAQQTALVANDPSPTLQ